MIATVKPRFKQTKVGVIPEEWGVARVAERVMPMTRFGAARNGASKGTPSGISKIVRRGLESAEVRDAISGRWEDEIDLFRK